MRLFKHDSRLLHRVLMCLLPRLCVLLVASSSRVRASSPDNGPQLDVFTVRCVFARTGCGDAINSPDAGLSEPDRVRIYRQRWFNQNSYISLDGRSKAR